MSQHQKHAKTCLITGAAKRIGAQVARMFHKQGYQVLLHYSRSQQEARQLANELNAIRPNSAKTYQADLTSVDAVKSMASEIVQNHAKLDVLVNNASNYYPTPIASASADQWDDLFGSNVKGHYFLIQGVLPALKSGSGGAVVNLVDIYVDRPREEYCVYGMAKASLKYLTLSLAKELAPEVRVNGVSPGAILWPDSLTEAERASKLATIPLKRKGEIVDISSAILYLAEADYVTGQILSVDGGRSLEI